MSAISIFSKKCQYHVVKETVCQPGDMGTECSVLVISWSDKTPDSESQGRGIFDDQWG